MTAVTQNQVFLIVTNVVGKSTIRQYYKIKKATLGLGDVYLLFHSNGDKPKVPDDLKIETFTDDILCDLGISPIGPSLVPGSNHFPVFDFFRRHPGYKYYWSIENDVAFNGDWKDFFLKVTNSKSDFITSHIRKYNAEPHWHWWDSYTAPDSVISRDELYRSFNPIYRLSHAALTYLYKCQLAGISGHHEVLLPSLLQKKHFTISDFGDQVSEHTPGLSFCTLKTMRWKPVFLFPGALKNKLYHPVKAKISFRQLAVLLKRSLYKETKYVT